MSKKNLHQCCKLNPCQGCTRCEHKVHTIKATCKVPMFCFFGSLKNWLKNGLIWKPHKIAALSSLSKERYSTYVLYRFVYFKSCYFIFRFVYFHSTKTLQLGPDPLQPYSTNQAGVLPWDGTTSLLLSSSVNHYRPECLMTVMSVVNFVVSYWWIKLNNKLALPTVVCSCYRV